MNTFRKICSAILVIVMMLSSVGGINVFADDAEPIVFTDVSADHMYSNAIYSLASEGIISGIKQEDGTYVFNPEDTITRAEVATLIAVAIAKDESLLIETTDKFPDVPVDHWANKYIAYAVKMEIIAGCDDGTFRPANPVTYGEVAKMLVCSKGYGVAYEATTPWYEGYVTLANKTNLTKNAVSTGDKEASRALVAQMIYNLKDVTYYQPKPTGSTGGGGGGGGGGNRVKDEDEVEDATGVLKAVFETNITGEEIDLTYKQVLIGDDIYNIGDKKLDDFYRYLGRRLDVEYEESRTGKRTIKKYELSSKDEVINIDSEDFIGINGREISYYPAGENKADKVILSDELCVIYNGKPVLKSEITDEFVEKYLNIENGSIRIINNNGGKDFEVAEVTKYDTYVVSSKTNSGDIYSMVDYFGQNYSFDVNLATLYVSKSKKSLEEGKASAIAAKKVVFVSQPYDTAEGTIIIISENKIQNKKVESISEDTIQIDGKEYKESAYFKRLKEEKPKEYGFENGDTGTFYLDYFGNIAFYEKAENKNPYAYVMGFENGDGLDGQKSIFLLTMATSGTTATSKVCFLDETVKINGQKKDSKELGSILKANAAVINKKSLDNDAKIENGEYSQLVRCKISTRKINDETVNFLDEIYTLDADDLEDGDIVPAPFRAVKTDEKTAFTDGKNRLKYVSSSKSFQDNGGSNQFVMNSSTVVILVPDDRSDSEEYKRRTYSYFSNGVSYDVEPYDIKSNIAGVVLVYTRGASTKPTVTVSTSPVYVVDVRDAQDPDGGNVQQLTYYDSATKVVTTTTPYGQTEPKKIITEKANTLSGVKAGDIIKFISESKKYGDTDVTVIIDVQKVFVSGVLHDWTGSAIYDTFPAEGNFIRHSNGSTTNYYEVIHGTLDSKMMTDATAGTISVVPMIVENKEDYNSDKYEQYNITASTTFFKWDSSLNNFVPSVDASYLVSVEEAQGDATSASRIVVIKAVGSGTNAKSIYILD